MDKLTLSSRILIAVFFYFSTTPSFAYEAHGKNRHSGIKVITQNLYVGADLMQVANASSPQHVPLAVAQTLEMIKQTNFFERAEVIAKQIKKEKPDLIGLQEVSLIRLQSPGDYFIGNPQQATDVLYDYLKILLTALERHDLHYSIASTVNNADIEMPAFTGLDANGIPQFIDVRLSDRDVILAKKHVKTSNPVSANFEINLALPIGTDTVPFIRGYTAVDAKVRGTTYRVVNTHLEVKGEGLVAAVQASQAQELIGLFASEDKPLVILGDFNSSPTDTVQPGSVIIPPYIQMDWAGYLDAWTEDNDTRAGFTCCQAENLANPLSQMNERIDYVFYRSNETALGNTTDIETELLGNETEDKTVSGLWPSDHAGLSAVMKITGYKNKHKSH